MFYLLEAAQEPKKNPEDGVKKGTREENSAKSEDAQTQIGPDGIDVLGVGRVIFAESYKTHLT